MKPRRLQSASTQSPDQGSFLYADYIKAKETLLSALKGPRFYALVCGSSGMGKTSLLRDISVSLDRHRHQVVYISCAQASVVSIVRYLANKLHVTPRRSYLETAQVLAEAIQAQTAHLLLWMDEVDQVQPDLLAQVRMMAESQLACEQLMSVVLSGLAAFSSQLDAPNLFPLKRRIAHRLTLTGLRRDELQPFLQHRFGDVEAERIPPSVHDELFERTAATPALIDTTVRHALKSSEQTPLDPELIRAALDIAGL
jgi:type II secretory pathway predicted ATPase ExeA